MKSVTIINCKKSASQEKKPLKVAAYCRVSTEYEDQISSLEFQVSHFSTMIQENPDWEFAGIYAEQESGIDIENREEMNRMIKDCEQGKIDLILTKSLSRFSRNTVDTLITYISWQKRILQFTLKWKG